MVEESKEKVSAAAIELLGKNGYAYFDGRRKIVVLKLTELSKNETVNSVAKWPGASQPVIAQIQDLLILHNKRPLVWRLKEVRTDKDVAVKELLDQYGNRITNK